MTAKPTLLFVSTRFLFPADSGGKIRTSQILRGLKGGVFRVRLMMPCDDRRRERFAAEVDSVCDDLVPFEERPRGRLSQGLLRLVWLFRRVPIPVMSDWSRAAHDVICRELARRPAIVVFDFPHSAILKPEKIGCASVMFTHNIEAEIFRRHLEVAKTPLHRWLWKNQHRKMLRFERDVLRAFDTTIAVSERDCRFFAAEYGIEHCGAIPTGVDTEFFDYAEPRDDNQVVFCGSMDWMANIDGMQFFHDAVWPLVREARPGARMKVVGRTPPPSLVKSIAARSPEWEFTGFVDDVRDHVAGAGVFVIPLRVGGGTRIKAFEAMAMGCPVVSTSIGIEGLPVEDGVHYLRGDTAEELAGRVVELLGDERRRLALSASARRFVEQQFGFRKAAVVFEDLCRATLARRDPGVESRPA